MTMLNDCVRALGALPDWVLLLVPALLAVYTLVTLLFGGRRVYPYIAFAALPLAAVLGAGHGAAADLVYVGSVATVACLLRLALLLPRRKTGYPCPRPTPSKEPTAKAERVERETCFIPAERCGLDMAHAGEYLARLGRAPLSAGDRLEVECLARALDGANRAALTEEELVRVNDALAAMFKIAAKYKV